MPPLVRHPGSPSGVTSVVVEATRPAPGRLELACRVHDPSGSLRIPPPHPPDRADGLWRRTCVEAFVRLPGSGGYIELNMSPSTAWAAYRFDGYRAGMAPAVGLERPRIESARSADAFELRAALDLAGIEGLPADGLWRVGLCAVIEDAAGLSYWALAHPAGEPDFHHADGFVLDLRVAG